MFAKLLQMCIENDVKLQLVIDKTETKVLYREVFEEYIRELQKEIDSVKERIEIEFACE